MVLERSMSNTPITILFLWLLILATVSHEFCYGSFNAVAGCSRVERDALLKFKHALTDPSSQLASWAGDGDGDCCRWYGVVCNNLTGHVVELHLRGLSPAEYYAINPGSTVVDDEANYGRYMFGGKISPSLVNLKHLRYLDVSNNNFGGNHIPRFLGLMGSLRHLNLSRARFAGIIPYQLGNLSNLHYLDLHGDDDVDHVLYVENLHWLSGLSSLEFLDLSDVDLSKAFNWLNVINTLPSLVQLHLSNCKLVNIPPLLNVNFSSLSILDLSSNQFDESLVPTWVFSFKTLFSLNLSDNYFQGPIPTELQNMSSVLARLDLSTNYFTSSIPNWMYHFSHLEFLSLGTNSLQGEILSAIGTMVSLTSLDLSNNELEVERGIPPSFKNLCNLRSLYLSGTKLSQDINGIFGTLLGCVSDGLELLYLGDCQLYGHFNTNHLGNFKNLAHLGLWGNLVSGPIPMSLGEMTSLRSLDLSGNKLNGTIPECFGGLKMLEMIDISYNSISGPMPMSLRELTSLTNLYLSHNKLNGTLPLYFGELMQLVVVEISYNSMEGDVLETHFVNLTKLRCFYASDNKLRLRVSPNWIPPLQLQEIRMRSWHIGPQFPSWLHSLKHLVRLDFSNSRISSSIPLWFWDQSVQLSYLNLSHNQIHGGIPNTLKFAPSGSLIDLSSNWFNGPLPHFFINVTALDLSNNSFSGSISNFLCYKVHELKIMEILNLGENLLSGEIPDCWMSWQQLVAVKLSNNKFSGNIPKSIGNLSLLQSLHIRSNNLSGELPLSLKNCAKLVTLDISENGFVGEIPMWIGERLSKMVILNLHANKFHGYIPKELCHLTSLQILDLAHNHLSGIIPRCINNLSTMATGSDSIGQVVLHINGPGSFFDNLFLVTKGKEVEYTTILNFVRSIDLSDNQLYGQIPKQVASLGRLQSLNLSQNILTGRIPEDLGALRSLESMDFSLNQLSGEIPQSISSLTFLSHLNLSNNKLSGMIPLGTQLQSFGPSSFFGNELCGLPLTNKCSLDGAMPGIENGREKHHKSHEVKWFYMGMPFGYAVGFWIVLGPLCFNRQWRYKYFHFLDSVGTKFGV